MPAIKSASVVTINVKGYHKSCWDCQLVRTAIVLSCGPASSRIDELFGRVIQDAAFSSLGAVNIQ